MGGACYEVSHLPQSVPDGVAEHLIEIGNAYPYETKVVEVVEKKQQPLSVSPAAQASPDAIATRPRGRKPKL